MVNVFPKATAEENILITLARDENPLTHYQLWKKHKVAASNKTVLTTLNRMEKNDIISFEQEKTGRKRKLYKLTIFGLLGALTYKTAWQTIDEIADAQKSLLPLVFGKWSFFNKERILDEIIERLKTVVFLKWKRLTSRFIVPETLDVFLKMQKMSTRQKLAAITTDYEQYRKKLSKFYTQPMVIEMDIPASVFGLNYLSGLFLDDSNFSSSEVIKEHQKHVEKQKKLFPVLRRDPDLKEYIDKRLGFDIAVLEIKLDNVESWKEWIDSIKENGKD